MRKTARQPRRSATSPATEGPTTEGRTQAAAKAAKTLARSSSGRARAISTASATSMSPSARPPPMRPATTTGIDGASPMASWPSTNRPSPACSGSSGPRRSAQVPATAVARTNEIIGAARRGAEQPQPAEVAPPRWAARSGRPGSRTPPASPGQPPRRRTEGARAPAARGRGWAWRWRVMRAIVEVEVALQVKRELLARPRAADRCRAECWEDVPMTADIQPLALPGYAHIYSGQGPRPVRPARPGSGAPRATSCCSWRATGCRRTTSCWQPRSPTRARC